MVSGCKKCCKHSLGSISVSKKRIAHLIILHFYAINELVVLHIFYVFINFMLCNSLQTQNWIQNWLSSALWVSPAACLPSSLTPPVP